MDYDTDLIIEAIDNCLKKQKKEDRALRLWAVQLIKLWFSVVGWPAEVACLDATENWAERQGSHWKMIQARRAVWRSIIHPLEEGFPNDLRWTIYWAAYNDAHIGTILAWETIKRASLAHYLIGHGATSSEIANYANCIEETRLLTGCVLWDREKATLPRHVVAMALEIQEHPESDIHPILADALEETGEASMATHLRKPHHWRGCHVIDSILGKR